MELEMLAIIGKSWLTAQNAAGRRRLDDPADFVRLETASALKRDIPVIPVLVQGASMSQAEQLPSHNFPPPNGGSLVCGEMHRARWGVTGYEDPKHWCNLAKKVRTA